MFIYLFFLFSHFSLFSSPYLFLFSLLSSLFLLFSSFSSFFFFSLLLLLFSFPSLSFLFFSSFFFPRSIRPNKASCEEGQRKGGARVTRWPRPGGVGGQAMQPMLVRPPTGELREGRKGWNEALRLTAIVPTPKNQNKI